MKNILWIGPILKPDKISNFKAVSPAANNWQISLIKALIAAGCNVKALSYIPEPFFPKGLFRVPLDNLLFNDFPLTYTSYINLPKTRDYSLAFNLLIKLAPINESNILITYNNSKAHVIAAKFLKFRTKSYWINIVADGDFVRTPDLTVFLSYGYYQKAKLVNKMHLDGGVSEIIKSQLSTTGKKIILFSGALTIWTGIEEFARQFSSFTQCNLELHIYGKGDSTNLDRLASNYKNIIVKGFVSDNELEKARSKAYAFVNPRPANINNGEKNFPSKILEYLQYGKPVLSTHTEGLAPCYDDLLIFYNSNISTSLESQLLYLNDLSSSEYLSLQEKIWNFSRTHTWDMQAKRLIQSYKHFEYER